MKSLKTACLAASGLVTAWGAMPAPAAPETVTLITDLNKPLSNAYFFLFTTNGSSPYVSTVYPLGNIPAGPNQDTVLTVDPGSLYLGGYSIAGEYDATNGLVTVGLSPYNASNAISGAVPFDTEFPAFTEATFASSLSSGNIPSLDIFGSDYGFMLASNFGTGPYYGGEAVNFSNATDGGATNAVIGTVPEPASIAGLGMGMSILLLRRRGGTSGRA
jgi:hypothetical protein